MDAEGTNPLLYVAGVAAAVFVLFLGAIGGFRSTAQASSGVPVVGRVGLWVPLAQQQGATMHLPALLVLGLTAAASGGDYQATVKTGTGQWVGLGLVRDGGVAADPWTPSTNMARAVRQLAGDVQGDARGNVSAALGQYGGTIYGPAKGAAFARSVLGYVHQLGSASEVSVWPASGRVSSGVWEAPPSAGAWRSYLIVTAMRPTAADISWSGDQWSAIRSPLRVTATVGGTVLAMNSSATAPGVLSELMPPGSSYWWAVVPVGTSQETLTATAMWETGHGKKRHLVDGAAAIVVREG